MIAKPGGMTVNAAAWATIECDLRSSVDAAIPNKPTGQNPRSCDQRELPALRYARKTPYMIASNREITIARASEYPSQ
jgi:hypothetical protein